MNRRTAARLGWSLFALSALLLAIAFVLNLGRPQYAGLGATTGELVLGPVLLVFGWFGALIVAGQPSQPIGWILCAFGGASGPVAFANEYAIYGLITHPGAAPGAAAVAWFTTWVSAVYLGLLAALLLLFPTGQPPSPHWRWWLWVAGIGNLLYILSALWAWPQRGPQPPATGYARTGRRPRRAVHGRGHRRASGRAGRGCLGAGTVRPRPRD